MRLRKRYQKRNLLPPCARDCSNILNLAHGHVIKTASVKSITGARFHNKTFAIRKFNALNLKPRNNKMAGYEGAEPSTSFCEIVYVGRRENGRTIRPHDVTIFYKFKSGRGGKSRSQFQMVLTK